MQAIATRTCCSKVQRRDVPITLQKLCFDVCERLGGRRVEGGIYLHARY